MTQTIHKLTDEQEYAIWLECQIQMHMFEQSGIPPVGEKEFVIGKKRLYETGQEKDLPRLMKQLDVFHAVPEQGQADWINKQAHNRVHGLTLTNAKPGRCME